MFIWIVRKKSILQMVMHTNSMHNLQGFHQNIYLLITLLSIVTNCLFVATELFHLKIHYLCLICVTIEYSSLQKWWYLIQKHLRCKKRCGQVKLNHTWKWIHEQIGDNKIWYQNAAKAYYSEYKHYTKHIIASYCLQSLIRPANLLSAISCCKFHISKDQQENMKFTIICPLATFFVSDYIYK